MKDKDKALINKINRLLIIIFIIILLLTGAAVMGLNPIGVVFLIIIFAYLRKQKKVARKNGYSLLNLILLMVIFLAISDVIIKNRFPLYGEPFYSASVIGIAKA